MKGLFRVLVRDGGEILVASGLCDRHNADNSLAPDLQDRQM